MVEFPIEGSLREPLLVVEGVIVVILIQLGIIFFRKYLRERETSTNNVILAWSLFLFTYSIVFLFYIIADFYLEIMGEGIIRDDLLNVSYQFAVGGAALFSFYTEREIKINHYFSISMFILTCGLIANAFLQFIESSVYLTFVAWLLFIVLIYFYIRYFTQLLGDKWRGNVYSLMIGVILIVLGFGGTSDWMVNAAGGLWMRFFGDAIIIMGTIFISMLFIGVPSLAEFDWHKKLRYLNVMLHTGISVAHYHFNVDDQEKDKSVDELLMAGGLTSISQIVSDIIQSEKKLDYIDHGDLKIIFAHGNLITSALIVEEPLEILRSKLRKFTSQVEFIYEENLKTWSGDLEQFQFIEALVKANFMEGSRK
ncbi:MAG: hypothetical protein EU536_00110 [Promethearchaeota archaeon]|nr:MAG: hypothetical protein EU536_00110 [Candidatus Lokiarchaeota archaeon]